LLLIDIVFFGESLGEGFERHIQRDLPRCDLLVVIGSSMRVRPVAAIPVMIPPDVPQILINRELVLQPHKFDIELLGDCDAITMELARRLGLSSLEESNPNG
ncbi:DHS-like NAD/FAD-binding domain-containing protein, partial [Pavlovales sp. CCMP2436]